ncbi:MAG: Uma2 family endonuclease [Isosphaeraceae bacterium]
MSKVATRVGPADAGRVMSLDEFAGAEAEPGWLYELSRGVVTVVDVPNPRHLVIVNATRRQFLAYDLAHPGKLHAVASGGECKLLIAGLESERHPDLAIYKTPPPEGETDDEIWSQWVPEIVVEVVSPSSRRRDYEEKPEEYLRLGVQEYWIVDEHEGRMTVLRRSRGRWVEHPVRPPAIYKTRLLPGLEFSVAKILDDSPASSS